MQFSGPETAPPESRLHLALAAGPGPYPCGAADAWSAAQDPASDVPGVANGSDKNQYDGDQPRQRARGSPR